jgi:opacity protein-like surface antigen
MSSICKKTLIVLGLAAILAAPVMAADADEENIGGFSRASKIDLFAMYQEMNGDSTSGDGMELSMDSTSLYGFGVGANIDDHWNINTEFLFGSTDFDGTAGGTTVTLDTDVFMWNFNVDYNLWAERLTPVVGAGIGLAKFSGDDFSETDFSYNFGAGVRWDATDNMFVKAMYRWTWTELEDTDSALMLDGFVVCVGWSW